MSGLLDVARPAGSAAPTRVTDFVCHVEGAAAFLSAAHAGDDVQIVPARAAIRQALPRHRGWYALLLDNSIARLRHIMIVFVEHPAEGAGAVPELEAFRVLSNLTPVAGELMILAARNRPLAYRELGKHLEIVGKQFEAAADLADELALSDGPSLVDQTEDRFVFARDALLRRAGGAVSLTAASRQLGISRQALHKRIYAGSALGMMLGTEIVVPVLQIRAGVDKASILPGIDRVTKLFKQAKADGWVTLQFLVDCDPNLDRAPIDALKAGEIEAVIRGARAHLALDED